MADDDQTTATPAAAPAGMDQATIDQYLALLRQGPPNIQPDQTPVDTSGFWGGLRHGVSWLGEAIGGGKGSPGYAALSPAEREAAGANALSSFGTGLLAASRYQPGQTIFSNLAQGFQGAERSYQGTERQAAGMLAARQDYANEQQANQLARIKEAIPLLTLQQQQKAADTARRIALGGNPPGGSIATGGSLGSVDVPPEYLPFYQEASARTGIPAEVLIAQGRQESGFNPGATGAAGEIGIGQISPKTATDPGYGMTGLKNPDALRDPRTNINFQADYLAARAKAAGADFSTPEGIAKALKAYNGGGDPNYVQNVTRYIPGARTALAPRPAPGQTAAATPPPPNAAPPPGPLPVPPIPPANPPPVVPPVAPPVQTAGPGAGNAPPGTPTAPVDPAAAPAPAPAIFTPRALTPSEQAATSYSLPPEQEAGFRRQVAEISGQPDAAPKIAAIEQARTAAIAVQREKADAARLAIEASDRADWQKQQAALQTQQFEREKAAEAARQQLELEKQKSVFNIDQEGARMAFATDKTRLDKMGEAAAAMLPVGNELRQLRPVLTGLPDAGVVSSTLAAYPQLTAAARMGGVISPQQADNLQVFRGLADHIAGQLRISGSGSMSDKDLETFKSTLPQLTATKEGRVKALAFLQNLSDRVVDEHDFAQKYIRRNVNGKPAYNMDDFRAAVNAPRDVDASGVNRGGLGPVVPAMPSWKGLDATTWIGKNVDIGHPYMGWGYPRDPRSGLPMPVNPKTGEKNQPELQLMVREN